jgi:hypothetical protein
MKSRGTSYLPFRVVLSSALSVVPQSQVCLAFLFLTCSLVVAMRTCFLHVSLSASAGTVICERWLSSSIADTSLAWIGRRKTLLAYTMIFAVGAVRYSRSVPPLLGLADIPWHRYSK